MWSILFLILSYINWCNLNELNKIKVMKRYIANVIERTARILWEITIIE